MKIATRLSLIAPGLVLATAVLVGLMSYWGYRSLVNAERIHSITARAEADSGRVSLGLQQFQDDLRFLASLPKIMEYIEASRLADPAAKAMAQHEIAAIFASLLQNRPHYDQVRLIGVADDGQELIRVERLDDAVTQITGKALQQKGHRDYMQETLALPPGRMYVSSISLNREHGALETPHRPALRIAMPLYDSTGRIFGLVIVNLNFTSFVRSLLPIDNSYFDYFMTNSDGGYVIHPDAGMEFGFDLGSINSMQLDYPELLELFRPGSSNEVGTATIAASGSKPGVIMQARRLHPFREEPSRFLVLAVAASADLIATPSQVIITRVLPTSMVLLILASVLAYVLTSHLMSPLKQLTESADRVTKRQATTFLNLERKDEIGALSRALDHMVKTLRRNEISLKESVRDLEYFSRIASHDLTEPARRIATLANLVQLDESERMSVAGRELLLRLRAEGLNMIRQLTDLRAFARLGTNSLTREETDLQTLVEQVIAGHTEEIQRRGVFVHIDPMPSLTTYKHLVYMLYQNLVDNALQHARQEKFELKVTCSKSGDELVLAVCNTGSVIDVDPETLFDAFYSGSTDSSRSGLGLSICKRIVERHSGRIWAEVEADQVRFLFTLTGGTA